MNDPKNERREEKIRTRRFECDLKEEKKNTYTESVSECERERAQSTSSIHEHII